MKPIILQNPDFVHNPTRYLQEQMPRFVRAIPIMNEPGEMEKVTQDEEDSEANEAESALSGTLFHPAFSSSSSFLLLYTSSFAPGGRNGQGLMLVIKRFVRYRKYFK